MRTIMYYIVNKDTRERVYANCRFSECEKKLNAMDSKEKFEIRHKWMSI